MPNSKHCDPNKQRQAKERENKFGWIGLYAENGKRFQLIPVASNKADHINGAYTNAAGYQSAMVDNSQKSFGEKK
jgi:hypothetical protein